MTAMTIRVFYLMSIRPLDLLDLPIIARYRNDVLTLDTTRALTRGHPLGAMGLLAYVNPARHLYAALANHEGSTLLGGIIHTRGETFAKLLYLAPSSNLDDPNLPALIEHLAAQAGEWQAYHVIAEVDETSDVFIALRKAGFSVYAWQRVWDLSRIGKTESASGAAWRRIQSIDLPAVQSLHYQIVPQLLHPVEPAPNRPNGLIHPGRRCFANVSYGVYGVALTPLILPDEGQVSEKLVSLVSQLPDRRGRSVYLNVRSYQAWLEPALEDLGAKAAPRQAVMVKHLARYVKDTQPARVPPSNARIQPTQFRRAESDE
ncbi:MAG: hypothetical protein IPG44_03540 [Anaerolineales bacterium]|jgi:hypothetical protein|nr:hypothetical protein [Chloroflexota bacterium]MBK6644817.1 hypothetical protein [Anaerolineales bacterium]MCC6986420.1 hypothetical protein [Anaerolineales bacterium]